MLELRDADSHVHVLKTPISELLPEDCELGKRLEQRCLHKSVWLAEKMSGSESSERRVRRPAKGWKQVWPYSQDAGLSCHGECMHYLYTSRSGSSSDSESPPTFPGPLLLSQTIWHHAHIVVGRF